MPHSDLFTISMGKAAAIMKRLFLCLSLMFSLDDMEKYGSYDNIIGYKI